MNDNNPQMMDAMSFNFIDIFLDTDKDEPLWDKLIQQIIDGNVIPVIGADMLIDNNVNPHQLLVDESLINFLERTETFTKQNPSGRRRHSRKLG